MLKEYLNVFICRRSWNLLESFGNDSKKPCRKSDTSVSCEYKIDNVAEQCFNISEKTLQKSQHGNRTGLILLLSTHIIAIISSLNQSLQTNARRMKYVTFHCDMEQSTETLPRVWPWFVYATWANLNQFPYSDESHKGHTLGNVSVDQPNWRIRQTPQRY